MKAKTIILIFLVLFFTNVINCQVKTTVFTLDLGRPNEDALVSTDSTKTKLVVKTRNPLSFILKNGNPYKYKYVINHRLVNFFEENAFNPLDSMAKKLSSQSSGGRGPASLPIDSLKSNSRYISEAQNAIDILRKNDTLANSLFIDVYINPIDEDEDVLNILSAQKLLRSKSNQLKEDVDSEVKNLESEDFLDTDEFVNKRNHFNNAYILLLSEINRLNQDAIKFPQIKTQYSEILEELIEDGTFIKREISKMFQLKIYNYIPPLDFNGKNIDLVEVTVERYEKSAANPTPEKYSYKIWVTGGIKIDVSAGIFLTSLKDKEYETVDKVVSVNGQDVTQKLIYEKNIGDLDFGVGSMINISPRGGSWIKPTANIGALFTSNQKFQLLGGMGLIFGKEERVVLHGGISLGSRTEISDRYKSDGTEAYDLGSNGDIPTDDKFTTGYFFGVTYNFGKTKKQSKAKDTENN